MSGVVVVDYGMGNLGSVAKALEQVSGKVSVSIASDKASILAADRVVFPGQGAMPDCMKFLRESGLLETVLHCCKTKPLFGVCVGEQMLFDSSEEGNTAGLGVLPGSVKKFKTNMSTAGGALKVPHMGWNKVSIVTSKNSEPVANSIGDLVDCHPLWSGIPDESFFYFVHSYFVVPQNAERSPELSSATNTVTNTTATSTAVDITNHSSSNISAGLTLYGERFTSAVARDNIFATQFHPEKSAALGLRLYQNFLSWKP